MNQQEIQDLTFSQVYKIDSRVRKICGIYSIKNTLTGKYYVGRSVNVVARLQSHISKLRTGKHSNEHLLRSFNLNKEDAFLCSLLEICDRNNLNEREVFYIKSFDSLSNGYNLNLVSFSENVHSKSTTLKRSASLRAYQLSVSQLKMSDVTVMREMYREGYAVKEIYAKYKRFYKTLGSVQSMIDNRCKIDNTYTKPTNRPVLNLEHRTKIETLIKEFGIKPGLMSKIYKETKGVSPTRVQQHIRDIFGRGEIRNCLLDLETGIFYFSIETAAQAKNITNSELRNRLLGVTYNNTSIVNCQ